MKKKLYPFVLTWRTFKNRADLEIFWCYSWNEALRVAKEYIKENIGKGCTKLMLEDDNGNTHKFRHK